MRRGIEHVAVSERVELERILEIIHEEFEDVLSLAQHEWKMAARITKIVLYGSHARGDWVDEHHTRVGKHSDWDLIILVNDERLTDRVRYWQNVIERLNREYQITHRLRSPTQFFVYTLDQINASLEQGRYFFIDFLRDGIIVYEKDHSVFVQPKPVTGRRQYEMSLAYFEEWFESAVDFIDNYSFAFEKGRLKNAAFQLHQCVERLYHTVLLTYTLYTPHNHNIVVLRACAEKYDLALREVWPQEQAQDVAAFEKLQQAYVKARYIKDFSITEEHLLWLGEHARQLVASVEASCRAYLAKLKNALQ